MPYDKRTERTAGQDFWDGFDFKPLRFSTFTRKVNVTSLSVLAGFGFASRLRLAFARVFSRFSSGQRGQPDRLF